MESITSKKSSFYYFSIIFLFGIFLLGVLMEVFLIYQLAVNGYKQKLLLLMFLGYMLIAIAIHYSIKQVKKAPVFTVTKNSITVKGASYPINDITTIVFTGKQSYGSFNHKLEGMQIAFKGNKFFTVYDPYYSNIAQLKQFLEKVWLNKTQAKKFYTPYKATDTDFNYYKGSAINFNLALLISILLFSLYIFLSPPTQKSCIAIIALNGLFWAMFCNRFYYFGLSNNFLVVKSFTFLWVKKKFSLTDIKEIIFETNNKAPYSMRIIMYDYTNHWYYATTLYDKHWRALKKDLEKSGIIVRDEIGITKT